MEKYNQSAIVKNPNQLDGAIPNDQQVFRLRYTGDTWFARPETNSKSTWIPGWFEDNAFLLEWPIFRGELLVSGRVTIISSMWQAVDRQQEEAVAPKQRIADEDELMVRSRWEPEYGN